jgi:hypothetical protein
MNTFDGIWKNNKEKKEDSVFKSIVLNFLK